MRPSQQVRFGGLTLVVSIGLGVLLQTTMEAFWYYRARPAGKVGVVHDLMVIWPTFVILLIPVAVGAAFLICGWFRRERMAKVLDELV